jgi:cell division septum initiation protein DivIVA
VSADTFVEDSQMNDGPHGQSRDGSPRSASPGAPTGDAATGPRTATTASDLEQRIAELAAQVRTLAQRFAGIPAESSAPQAASLGSADREPGAASHPSSQPPEVDPGTTRAIVAAAEAAAGEIRAIAEHEAALIRAAADSGRVGGVRALRDTIAEQRETLRALAAEATRVERTAAILQAQVRALEAEMHQALAVVDALAESER